MTHFWGSHLISSCSHQISVFHLTEWTALINSRNDQLWMQSDPRGDYRLLSSDLRWSQQPATPGRLSTNTAVSQTANMKTAGTTYLLTLHWSCRSNSLTQTCAVCKHIHAHMQRTAPFTRCFQDTHTHTSVHLCVQYVREYTEHVFRALVHRLI